MVPANVVELARQCEKAVARGSKGIPLVMNGQCKSSATRRRLAGRSGPLGEIVSDTEGGQIVSFDPLDVLAFFAPRGWIKVVSGPTPANA